MTSKFLTIGAIATAGLVLAAGPASLAAAQASPSKAAQQHTWNLTLDTTVQQIVGTTYLESDTVSRDGQVAGLAVPTCPGAAQADVAVARCVVEFGLAGGTLGAVIAIDNGTGAVTGRLAGGTGRYRTACGRVSGEGSHLTLVFAGAR